MSSRATVFETAELTLEMYSLLAAVVFFSTYVYMFCVLEIDFGSSVRKLIGSKSSTPPAAPVSRPSGIKLSGYFQRSSSATASGFRRVGQQPLPPLPSQSQQERLASSHLSGSSLGLSQAPAPNSVLPSDLCPSCLMPFDKNRKRRLIDSCGHERCYACLFSSELCPLCSSGKISLHLKINRLIKGWRRNVYRQSRAYTYDDDLLRRG